MSDTRMAAVSRKTKETDIKLSLCLNGSGKIKVATGFPLFDHMLDLTFFWANMDLNLECVGDLEIDAHHTMEDCGLALGSALISALGDRRGIKRVGNGRVPMDEALADVSVDLSGRSWLVWRGGELLPPLLAGQEKDVWREFYKSISSAGRFNLHISFLYGSNGHHLLESAAKGFGIALRQAVKKDGEIIRSTKGELD